MPIVLKRARFPSREPYPRVGLLARILSRFLKLPDPEENHSRLFLMELSSLLSSIIQGLFVWSSDFTTSRVKRVPIYSSSSRDG
ncbi:hypothetical protein M413DRAFT_445325 [Hebeloma cylindrosporum]|uniref:Uncharacterized protein n=1 Tax=Hebeloma cylindrosporum TaxID=76867 RepID=A0A0C3CCF2_HEBCY|nr:hypothetical protein M413DRAFT_445325 [Hebeloma cylindrosporum h7]